MIDATREEAQQWARKCVALMNQIPEGWGLFCMDAELWLIPPDEFAKVGETDVVTAGCGASDMIGCGSINGDSGGW